MASSDPLWHPDALADAEEASLEAEAMTKTKNPRKLFPFDAARYLTDDAAIAEYMNAVLEANDPDLLLLALGDIARARKRTSGSAVRR